jgi:hypothetical protein
MMILKYVAYVEEIRIYVTIVWTTYMALIWRSGLRGRIILKWLIKK